MFLEFFYKKLIEKPYPRMNLRNSPFYLTTKSLSSAIYKSAFEYSQYIPEKTMLKIQQRRIMALALRAKKKIPFYANYLKEIETIDDFKVLPPISKTQLRREFGKETCFDPTLEAFEIPQFTSGSIGVPFQFFMDANMLARRAAIYRRMISWCGGKNTDAIVLLMPRIHPGLENEVIFFQCVDPDEIEKKLFPLYALFKNQSTILQSRASHLVRLAKFLERDKKNFKFKALISYTEMLLPETRAYLERIFKAPVFNYYACNEIAAIAQECEIHDGLHVNSEWVFVEIVDGANKSLPPGEIGYILVTSFDNEVMPFIRYKLGDKGCWLNGPCPCGRTLPRIRIEGREDNSFLLSNGNIGYLATLMWPIVQRIDKILQYQVIRRSMTDFEIKLRPAPGFTDKDKEFIIKRFREYLGKDTNISFEIVKKIELTPGGKELAFINLAPGK